MVVIRGANESGYKYNKQQDTIVSNGDVNMKTITTQYITNPNVNNSQYNSNYSKQQQHYTQQH